MEGTSMKNKLLEWKENDWNIPEEVNKYELALELIGNFKSIDPILRDNLSLSFLWGIIDDEMLSKSEVSNLLTLALSDKHLFYKLDSHDEDAVFNRAFSALIIGAIIGYHNDMLEEGQTILSKDEIVEVFNMLMEYLKKEKDVRGYVDVKGWAHSAAHTGDALASLAGCSELSHENMIEILNGIREKVTIDYYVYKNVEAERITTVIMNIFNRDDIKEEDIIEWIRSFDDLEKPKTNPEYHNFIENTKNFLRSMYFRFKFKGVNIELLNEIEKVLNKINERFNEFI
ncbi:DUF2785 domain-containing protein [Oceanirhabdus sp. W0125-5]|uniref:DUF2785 domain-containing protein n=1 Tax=Oceanirhabdus sp. W0125-5 TaxID=2999116 RepID=UPI0022F2AF5C|nr:DUF2785 domain-containing protein [Oceanirhabdus sp. W0125-5]WBW97804.1 DUF2785 domain-containing protein [Oceanirhabdus sp. W0125-5]